MTAGAALLVDPDDVAAIREQLLRLIEDNLWRTDAKACGLKRAATLTWDRCVKQTVEVYRSVV